VQLTIMSMLGPLRRICSGGALRSADLQVPDIEPDAFKLGAGALGKGKGNNRCFAAMRR
jgi:hypothetical protein